MTLALPLAVLLQIGSTQSPDIPVQLGVKITPDSVTVGQRFVAIIRVRAPAGAAIELPAASDSAARSSVTATELVGQPVMQQSTDSTGMTMSGAYRLAAWDIGPQRLGLPDIIVRSGGKTGYVSLADRIVFVRSVLPEDSALRVAKPPRPAIQIPPFDWLPWALLAAALLASGLAWRIWVWYRRRKGAPLDPFKAAEREFGRIEAMKLVETGEGERYATLMTDVMRVYLAASVAEITPAQTSAELLSAAGPIHSAAGGIGDLLWQTDLIKFAALRIPANEAQRLGKAARAIVNAVEEFLLEREAAESERQKAA
ncbi:MAG TPA: hypothetical protein VHM24_01645 [Gemmatimonadaceae bacterium]|nr:hypothetical protein [Gemmatimonadaceae bacterium]